MDKKYRTGILWQDFQHSRLFNLIDTVNRQASGERGNESATVFLAMVTMHLHEHFDLEEEYMRYYNYPDIDIHVQEHKNFISQLKAFKKSRPDLKVHHVRDAMNNAVNEIKEHILNNDKKLGEFILSREMKFYEAQYKKKK